MRAAHGVLLASVLVMAAGCTMPWPEGDPAPYEGPTTNTTITRELVLTQGRSEGGNAVTSKNCLVLVEPVRILRGTMEASWSPISSTTRALTLEVHAQGRADPIVASEDQPSPLQIKIGDVEGSGPRSIEFMVVLGHDGSVRDQLVDVTLDLEVAGSVAPTFEPAACTG